jgi:peptidoglycan/LPS O-acetylase OafA/YrhL
MDFSPSIDSIPTDIPPTTAVTVSQPTTRIEWLDATRGLACLLVLVIHYYHIALIAVGPAWFGKPLVGDTLDDTLALLNMEPQSAYLALAPFILGYWDIGKIGVLLFFLISGFVIPMSLLRLRKKPLLTFAISRFFRLYPVYWLSIILFCVVLSVFPMEGKTWSWSQLAVNFTMFQKFVGVADINGVAWTLQIELIFYGMCAMLFGLKLIRETWAVITVWGLLLVASLGFAALKFFKGIYTPVALPLGLSYMVLGYLSRSVIVAPQEEAPLVSKPIFWLIAAITLVTASVACYWGYTEFFVRYTVTYAAAFALYFVAQVVLSKPQKMLKTLGEISYSVYLFHPIVGIAFLFPLVSWLAPNIPVGDIWVLLGLMVVASAVTLVFSYCTYRWLEKPAITVGRNLIKQVNQ